MIRHRPRIIYWQGQRQLTLSTTHFPTDAGIGSDGVVVALNVFDSTGIGSDVVNVANAVTPNVPDSASGADSVSAAPALSPLIDVAAGIDIVQVNDGSLHGTIQPPWRMIKSRQRMLLWAAASIVNFKINDTVAGSDSPTIAADTGGIPDSGTGSDSVTLAQQALITVIDEGGFAQDNLTPISVTAQLNDAASVNEALTFQNSLSLNDSGTSGDAAIVATQFLVNVADSMFGDDSASPSIAVQIGVPDAAQATEIAGQFDRAVIIQDTGLLFDTFHVPEAPQQIFSTDRWWVIQAQKRTWKLQ